MTESRLMEFADNLEEIMPALMKKFARYQVSELYQGQITLPQFMVLNCLAHSGESKMKDLAGFMHVTTAAMTGIVERLVRDGYVKRLYDPQDRRIIKTDLTAKGKELLSKIRQQRRRLVIKVFSKISDQDRKDYLRILRQISEVLTEEKPA